MVDLAGAPVALSLTVAEEDRVGDDVGCGVSG